MILRGLAWAAEVGAGILTLLLIRWSMAMSSPRKDWHLLDRWLWRGKQRIARLLAGVRVRWLAASGYTRLQWVLLRRKWRTRAAFE